MANFTVLDPAIHGELKVQQQRAVPFAQGRHMLPLNVAELSHAIIDFPVLISRVQGQGGYALSALTSFTPGQNLFLKDGAWLSGFVPAEMQTFPFVLIPPQQEGAEIGIGFDATQPVFSQDGSDGVKLFDDDGQPSLWLNQVQAQLKENLKNMFLTVEFFQTLEKHQLISDLVLVVQTGDEDPVRINGLSSINEDTLKSLSGDTLAELNQKGFLGPIHAILFSILQLNELIRRHNAVEGHAKITKISLEMAKDTHS